MSDVKVLEYAKSGLPGVSKTVKNVGSGPKPKMGEVVTATFNAFLDDGRVIAQSSKASGDEFTVGMRQLWGTGGDLALLSMSVGERAHITCEHEFAGTAGNARLTLEVRLLDVIDAKEVAAREMRFFATCLGGFLLAVFGMLYIKGFHLFGW